MSAPGLIPSWVGAPLCDRDGARVGTVEDVLFDETTKRPAWLLVNVLPVGVRHVVVPAGGALSWVGHVTVPFTREQVRGCPMTRFGAQDGLSPEHAVRVCRHYGMRPPAGAVVAAHPERHVAELALAS